MGIVFEATDTVLSRRVALKVVLPRAGADAAQIQEDTDRFMREARLSANLPKHPHIVGVYDAGAVDGRCYLAMEFIDGQSLSRKRGTAPAALRDEVRILRDVCRGVHHAHRHSVMHRDLKPDNILVSADQQPHVTDFGLAKSLDSATNASLTAQGRVMGTPRYMSPEQAEGLETVDSRSDIYSLGVMLYEVLAGRPPHTGKTPVELLMKIVREDVTPPSAGLPAGSVDLQLEAICLKAIAKDPSRRQPTAEVLAADLEGWLAGPGPAPTPGAPPARPTPAAAPAPVAAPVRAPVPTGRRRIGRSLLVVALLLLGAGLGAFLVATTPQQRQSLLTRARAILEREEGPPPAKTAPGPAKDARDSSPKRGKEEASSRSVAEIVAQHAGPVDAGFIGAVARLSPDEQVLAVTEKLKALNPQYSGKVKHRIEQGKIVEWISASSAVTDLTPLRALPWLKVVEVPAEWDVAASRFIRSKLSDLTPLRGMALQRLRFPGTAVHDLAVLHGMPLENLRCDWTEVSDLTPLSGAPLTWLDIAFTPVSSLTPLAAAPLEYLDCGFTKVSDLSPLHSPSLRKLLMHNTRVTDFSPLRTLQVETWRFDYVADRDAAFVRSLKTLTEINEVPAAEFLAKYARPWDSLFDGKSVGTLLLQPSGAWALDKGTLTSSGNDCTLLTKEDVEDGEFRIRFRSDSLGFLSLAVRHAGEKGFSIVPDPSLINASKGKLHEVLFTCKEDHVTALFDGKEVPLKFKNGPRKGPIQIHGMGGGHFVLVSLERR